MARFGMNNDDQTVDETFDPNAVYPMDGMDDDQNDPLVEALSEPEVDEDGVELLPRPAGPAQRRGPQPGFMGQGRIPSNDIAAMTRDFWNNNQNNGSNNEQTGSSQQQFSNNLIDKLGELTAGSDRSAGNNANDDAGWDAFFNQRGFAPAMDVITQKFNEAGNDPAKTQLAIRELLETTARATYRSVATDMQTVVTKALQQMVPAMMQEQLQRVDNERKYGELRAKIIQRNPHFGVARVGPLLDQVLAQALTRTNGQSERALALAEAFMAESFGGSRQPNNTTRNNRSGGTINWASIANDSRRR